jgi:hypothetical protein
VYGAGSLRIPRAGHAAWPPQLPASRRACNGRQAELGFTFAPGYRRRPTRRPAVPEHPRRARSTPPCAVGRIAASREASAAAPASVPSFARFVTPLCTYLPSQLSTPPRATARPALRTRPRAGVSDDGPGGCLGWDQDRRFQQTNRYAAVPELLVYASDGRQSAAVVDVMISRSRFGFTSIALALHTRTGAGSNPAEGTTNICATPGRVLVVAATLPLAPPRRHNWAAELSHGIIAVARHGLAVADSRVPHRPQRSLFAPYPTIARLEVGTTGCTAGPTNPGRFSRRWLPLLWPGRRPE